MAVEVMTHRCLPIMRSLSRAQPLERRQRCVAEEARRNRARGLGITLDDAHPGDQAESTRRRVRGDTLPTVALAPAEAGDGPVRQRGRVLS